MRRSVLRPPTALLIPREACVSCQAARLFPTPSPRRTIYKPTSRSNPPTFRNKSIDPNYILQQQIALVKKAQGIGDVLAGEEAAAAKGQGALIPEDVFRAAHAAGALPIEPKKCLIFRRRFEALGAAPTVKDFQALITALDINVDHVLPLCRILLRSRSAQEKTLGSVLLLMACKAGSRPAVVWNLQAALKQGQFNHTNLRSERQQLSDFVNEGTYIPALMLQASIYTSTGNIAAAMNLWTRVTQLPPETPASKADEVDALGLEDAIFQDLDVCSAWISIGNECMDIYSEHHDFDRGKEAFRVAAVDHDDPYAYHHLALTEDPYTPLWIEYHTKAAASGHATSASALGKFYSLPLDEFEARVAEFKDPSQREPTRHEFLDNPCLDWMSEYRATLQDRHLRWLSQSAEIRNAERQPSAEELRQSEARIAAIQRAYYAIQWYRVASQAGDALAAIDGTRLLWFCGEHVNALNDIKYARNADYRDVGEQAQSLNHRAQALFMEWQQDDIWQPLFAHNAEVRALHEQIGAAKKFVREKLEWGFEARNPAFKKMKQQQQRQKQSGSA